MNRDVGEHRSRAKRARRARETEERVRETLGAREDLRPGFLNPSRFARICSGLTANSPRENCDWANQAERAEGASYAPMPAVNSVGSARGERAKEGGRRQEREGERARARGGLIQKTQRDRSPPGVIQALSLIFAHIARRPYFPRAEFGTCNPISDFSCFARL